MEERISRTVTSVSYSLYTYARASWGPRSSFSRCLMMMEVSVVFPMPERPWHQRMGLLLRPEIHSCNSDDSRIQFPVSGNLFLNRLSCISLHFSDDSHANMAASESPSGLMFWSL